jgi:hypothetical protein
MQLIRHIASGDRSIVPSKASSLHSAIWCFPFQYCYVYHIRETLRTGARVIEEFHNIRINTIFKSLSVTKVSPVPSFFRCPVLVLYLTLFKFNAK